MVWEWSYSQEGLAAIQSNVYALPRKDLEVIYAEWKASPEGYFHPRMLGGTQSFDQDRYERALSAAKYLPDDSLAEKVHTLAERLSNCDNGGFHVWTCPHGCEIHKVTPHDDNAEEDDS